MAEDLVREYRREREILLRKLEATVKTIIVTLVLAGGVAAIWAQSPPIKWPEQVERSKWPVFYQGAIEQTATICVDVAPKLSPAETRALYSSANYELAFQPATQFRLVVDGEQRYISFGRITGSNSSFSFKPGRHSIEIAVREPASSVRLSMMLRTMDEGDQPDAIHLCSAAASGDPLIAPPDVALPKASLKKFTPPEAVLNNLNPKLAMEPTIIAPPDVNLPNVNMAQYGDPFAKIGPASNGPGSGGGIGTGSGGGVGSGRGPGVGPGEGGGFGGGAFRIGGGVSAPVPIFKPEPEYSEEARKAKFQGTVMLAIVVDTDGKAKDIRVVRSLGMGLDEKAIEAVAKWRFKPGYKDGKPVPVKANVEVNFRLL